MPFILSRALAAQGAAWSATARTLVPVLGASWAVGASTDGSDTTGEVIRAEPVPFSTSSVTGLPGAVLSWEYSHTGASEELSVTVAGRYGLATPTATLRAVSVLVDMDGEERPLDTLGPRTFREIGQEPEVNVGEDTTTFHFKNSFDRSLRGVKLPELIPWQLNPTPRSTGACVDRPRQRKSVGTLVREALHRHVDPLFTLEDDPLAGAEWIEDERDFSTRNLSPQALWDQTYGLLGMVLHVRPSGSGVSLVGRWPQPVHTGGGGEAPASLVTSRVERRELLQTPGSVTLRGAPYPTLLNTAALLNLVGADPARMEIERAVQPDGEWYETPGSADTTTTRRGFRKARGQLVETVEVTTGEVTARETIEGKEVIRPFWTVMLGYKHVRTVYDPACPDRPLFQQTTTHAWGYTPSTQTTGFSVAGPGIFGSYTAGDLTASEETTTTFLYSPQGWLSGKVTSSRRLGSLSQEGAEDEPKLRGPLTAREYVTSVRTESWRPTGSGRWLYDPGTSGQTLVPVYDAASGEAIRTVAVTRATPNPPEITDASPPSYRCADPACPKQMLDDTGVVLTSGDAGFAEGAEISLPFLPPARLESVGRRVLASQWWRIVTTFELPYALGTPVGSAWGGGLVREVRVSGSSQGVTSSVTVARLDPLMPVAYRMDGIRTDPTRGRATMLAGTPGGARVRLVKGWDPQAGKPDVEDGFVAFRTGFPPSPGDEIEWQLNPTTGQKEARSASS